MNLPEGFSWKQDAPERPARPVVRRCPGCAVPISKNKPLCLACRERYQALMETKRKSRETHAESHSQSAAGE